MVRFLAHPVHDSELAEKSRKKTKDEVVSR